MNKTGKEYIHINSSGVKTKVLYSERVQDLYYCVAITIIFSFVRFIVLYDF